MNLPILKVDLSFRTFVKYKFVFRCITYVYMYVLRVYAQINVYVYM